jgi:hypothetical protein
VVTKLLENLQIPDGQEANALDIISLLVSDAYAAPYIKELTNHIISKIKGRNLFVRRLIASVISHGQKSIQPVYGTSFLEKSCDTATKLLIQILWLFCHDMADRTHLHNTFKMQDKRELTQPLLLYTVFSSASYKMTQIPTDHFQV